MICDLALDGERLPLPDMEEVYRIAAARVTDAVQRGLVDLALRWGRVLNLALRDRQMRARLPVTAAEVGRRCNDRPAEPEPPADAPTDLSDLSDPSHSSHPVFTPRPDPAPIPPTSLLSCRRWLFREGERRR